MVHSLVKSEISGDRVSYFAGANAGFLRANRCLMSLKNCQLHLRSPSSDFVIGDKSKRDEEIR